MYNIINSQFSVSPFIIKHAVNIQTPNMGSKNLRRHMAHSQEWKALWNFRQQGAPK